MRQTANTLEQAIRRLRGCSFDVDAEEVLVYRDPIIGRLSNESRQLTTLLNRTSACLEVRLEGNVVSSFPLVPDVEEACRQAFGAYFAMFEALCHESRQQALAA